MGARAANFTPSTNSPNFASRVRFSANFTRYIAYNFKFRVDFEVISTGLRFVSCSRHAISYLLPSEPPRLGVPVAVPRRLLGRTTSFISEAERVGLHPPAPRRFSAGSPQPVRDNVRGVVRRR